MIYFSKTGELLLKTNTKCSKLINKLTRGHTVVNTVDTHWPCHNTVSEPPAQVGPLKWNLIATVCNDISYNSVPPFLWQQFGSFLFQRDNAQWTFRTLRQTESVQDSSTGLKCRFPHLFQWNHCISTNLRPPQMASKTSRVVLLAQFLPYNRAIYIPK